MTSSKLYRPEIAQMIIARGKKIRRDEPITTIERIRLQLKLDQLVWK
jgi:hypothetical protein